MQLAIGLGRVLADREAAQHLAGMVPERGADLGEDDVAALDLAVGRKLRRHRDLRIEHRGDAEVVDGVGAARGHVGPLDRVGKLAFGQARMCRIGEDQHQDEQRDSHGCLSGGAEGNWSSGA